MIKINIKKYAILFILTVASVAVKADYGKIQTIKITLKSGDVYEYYVPKINSITFSENKVNEPEGEGTLDLNVIIGELQSVLADEKNSVVPTNTTEYERNRTASVDVFAGYVTPNSQFGGWLKHTYQWPNRYYNLACNAGPVDMLYNAYTYAESLGVPEYKAIAQIVYAQTALNAVNAADIAAWATIYFEDINANPLTFAHNLYIGNVLAENIVITAKAPIINNAAFSGCTSIKTVVVEDAEESLRYYRDEAGVHHVPKLGVDKLII